MNRIALAYSKNKISKLKNSKNNLSREIAEKIEIIEKYKNEKNNLHEEVDNLYNELNNVMKEKGDKEEKLNKISEEFEKKIEELNDFQENIIKLDKNLRDVMMEKNILGEKVIQEKKEREIAEKMAEETKTSYYNQRLETSSREIIVNYLEKKHRMEMLPGDKVKFRIKSGEGKGRLTSVDSKDLINYIKNNGLLEDFVKFAYPNVSPLRPPLRRSSGSK